MIRRIIVAGFILAGLAALAADDVAKWDPNMANSSGVVDTNGVKWIDGKFLPVEGRWTLGGTPEYYARLPDTLTTNVNAGVRNMRTHTAGIQFRFRTESKFIMVRYESATGGYSGSGNLTGLARAGWDMYFYDPAGKHWRFLNTSHNSSDIPGTKARVKRIGWGREKGSCIINLPLYDGVKEFAIGIEPTARIEALPPRQSGVDKPVVFYGTSITHGASASRPGLAFVNWIGRELDVPVLNLGFSGSGKMEYELSEVLAQVDASCYVLDCLWNMSYQLVTDRYEPFIRNLRRLRPDVPIVMAEGSNVYGPRQSREDKYIRGIYDKLVAEGWKNLVYLPNTEMYDLDTEGSVDTVHPNDLGMKSMTKSYGAAVRRALGL